MAEIKDVSRIAQKWARVAPQRTQDYSDGISAPRRDWAASASAAQDTHTAAMQKAATQKAFSRGVRAAGTAKWQSRALAKGPNRYAEGVAIAEPDYRAGFSPFAETIARTTLPPRFPKGDPRNLERVKVIAQALHAKKTGTVS
ncbi:MAG: hypothetical protein ACYTAO_02450 [Planctomycetota bacterium]|jgi:hypothetical protein